MVILRFRRCVQERAKKVWVILFARTSWLVSIFAACSECGTELEVVFLQCCCFDDVDSDWHDQGFGMELEMDSYNQWRVAALSPKSPAADTDLMVGDIVVSVDSHTLKVL